MKIYGHRGVTLNHPENTIPALLAAVQQGADGLEFDVRVSSDGIPVLLHDRSLHRVWGLDFAIDDLSLAQLQTLLGGPSTVPTLASVLSAIPEVVHLDIELKTGGAENALWRDLSHEAADRFAISSFDWSALSRLRALSSMVHLWPITAAQTPALLAFAEQIGTSVISIAESGFTPETARLFREAKLDAIVWTVNSIQAAERVAAIGAFAICTDHPGRFKQKQ